MSGGTLWGSSSDSFASETGHYLVQTAPVPTEPTTWGRLKRLGH